MRETKPNLVVVAAGCILNKISSLDYASIGLPCELIELDGDRSVGEWIVAMEHPWQLTLIFCCCCNTHMNIEW